LDTRSTGAVAVEGMDLNTFYAPVVDWARDAPLSFIAIC
jgi:hypothetical protein